jgi:hypothetical protein
MSRSNADPGVKQRSTSPRVSRSANAVATMVVRVLLLGVAFLSGLVIVLYPLASAAAEAKRANLGLPEQMAPNLVPPTACICFVLALVGLAVSFQREP